MKVMSWRAVVQKMAWFYKNSTDRQILPVRTVAFLLKFLLFGCWLGHALLAGVGICIDAEHGDAASLRCRERESLTGLLLHDKRQRAAFFRFVSYLTRCPVA